MSLLGLFPVRFPCKESSQPRRGPRKSEWGFSLARGGRPKRSGEKGNPFEELADSGASEKAEQTSGPAKRSDIHSFLFDVQAQNPFTQLIDEEKERPKRFLRINVAELAP